MDDIKKDLSVTRRECIELPAKCKSVLLTPQSNTHSADVETSPFIQMEDEFYIYLGQSSVYSEQFLDSGAVNIMFVEGDIASPQVYSKRRLSYECETSAVERGYQYTRIMVAFQERMGSFMDILRKLPGARLFRVTPSTGWYTDENSRSYTFKGTNADSLCSTTKQVDILLQSSLMERSA